MTKLDQELRKASIGASEISKIMSGDMHAIHELWLEKTGRVRPADLSSPDECENWFQVRMGTHTESINIQARIDTMPEYEWTPNSTPLYHPDFPFISATVDAYAVIGETPAVVDAKHTHGFNGNFPTKEDRLTHTYWWQMQQQMLVTGREKAIITPIYGSALGDLIFIDAHPFDQECIIDKSQWFWDMVTNDIAPEAGSHRDETVKSIPQEYRQIKLEETNFSSEIEELAGIWIENKPKEKLVKDADKAIKALIPDDVNVAEGHGVKITRTKPSKTRPNGSLSIKAA